MPIGATCFFRLTLPPYATESKLREKLLYSIMHCESVDVDNDPTQVDDNAELNIRLEDSEQEDRPERDEEMERLRRMQEEEGEGYGSEEE